MASVNINWRIEFLSNNSGRYIFWRPWPSCSKLTMLLTLVNIFSKFRLLNMAYILIFLLQKVSSFCICKSYSHFFSKNTCELDIVLTKTVKILTINELIKLTMLWTTGPQLLYKARICDIVIFCLFETLFYLLNMLGKIRLCTVNLFARKERVLYFQQIASQGNSLYAISNPVFWRRKNK